MAMGLLLVTTVPVGCSVAAADSARPDHVEPACGSTTVNGTPAGCPTSALVGVMVTVVFASVATMSKPEVAL
jgi:hypothetical protein